jgi:hypothetical protein
MGRMRVVVSESRLGIRSVVDDADGVCMCERGKKQKEDKDERSIFCVLHRI